MNKTTWIRSVLIAAIGLALGIAVDQAWQRGVFPTVFAQQGRAAPLPTMESLPAEVAQLKTLVPSNSHIMMDVQFHWTNLWWAGQFWLVGGTSSFREECRCYEVRFPQAASS